MKRLWKVLVPVGVLLAALLASTLIRHSSPEPKTRPNTIALPAVEATRLQATDYPVIIDSQGIVEPTVATALVPEVSGTIVSLSKNLVVGGSFASGELLVQIDERDYRIALTQAQATLAQNRAQLLEQEALADQAGKEWQALGRRGAPSSLTLREPQLAAARASLEAAKAQVERARLDLSRTRIVAPYAGQVLERQIQLGEFVARGQNLGRIYSSASLDVRLPLSNRQLTWLELPGSAQWPASETQVQIRSRASANPQALQGRLIRAEGIDAITQQLDVIARIDNPQSDARTVLRPGQFVDAAISGSVLKSVFVIPRSAVREQREVLILDQNNEVFRRQITVAWADDKFMAVSDGLKAGEVLVLTRMRVVAEGTPVKATIDGAPASEPAEPLNFASPEPLSES